MAKKRKSAKRRYHCTRRKVGVDGKKHCARYAGKSPAKGRRCGIMGINRLGKPVCLRYKGAHKTETRMRKAAAKRARTHKIGALRRGMFGPVYDPKQAGQGVPSHWFAT